MSVDSRSRVAISKFFANPAGSIILTLVSVLSAGYISICSSPILMQCQAILGTLPKETPPPDTYIHSIVALALAVLALSHLKRTKSKDRETTKIRFSAAPLPIALLNLTFLEKMP
ncbi:MULTISPECIES: hypothetical protein [Pseudomonas]|uniref:Uncharacterized protein n=1 Tax=Pseudomonas umsongensis TaxID=198618 RepID=A0ACC5M8M6_9PSED|nr:MULTISPECIES: hypothetical protein [Pseudomonas]MBB2884960.1 hypothetical protein [Pseudomonas umsongensis]NMN74609.1 hypothetical protein [Pseudomonas sp. KD5]